MVDLLRNYREIERSMSRIGQVIPSKVSKRLLSWLLVEAITRKPSSYYRTVQTRVPFAVRKKVETQISLFCGYQLLMGFDDAVDIYRLEEADIYDQLSRCLVGFLIEAFCQVPVQWGLLSAELQRWSHRDDGQFASFPEYQQGKELLLGKSRFYVGLNRDQPLSIQTLFFTSEYPPKCSAMLNLAIAGAAAMGKTFRFLKQLLQQHGIYDQSHFEWQTEFIVSALLNSMCAQAQTPRQRELTSFSLEAYTKIAYAKSNLFLNIGHCIRDLLDRNRLIHIQGGPFRFCEQLLDDFTDLDEDTRDQVLGFFHLHLVEKGRLAEAILQSSSPILGAQVSDAHIKLVAGTPLLTTHIAGVFVYHNPVVEARRDEEGRIVLEADNYSSIFREVFVTSAAELDVPLEQLLLRRTKEYEAFEEYWNRRQYETCIQTVLESSTPTLVISSLIGHIKRKKQWFIQAHSNYCARLAGLITYHGLFFTLCALRSKYNFARVRARTWGLFKRVGH